MKYPLLKEFVQLYAFQPATAFWRAIEIQVLGKYSFPEGRGLDLGCGDGKLTSLILKHTNNRVLVGIDPDPKETEQAQTYPFYEKVYSVPGDAIPEPDQSFDFVLSNSVLEHIPNLDPVIAEVSRLLKSEGVFIFNVPGPGFHNCLKGPINPFSSRERYLKELDERIAHYRYPTINEWRTLLASNAMELSQYNAYLNRAETRRWETLSRFTGGLLYNVFGKKSKPITIQRQLGMRQTQNRIHLPDILASFISFIISLGVNTQTTPTDEMENGCLLIIAKKK